MFAPLPPQQRHAVLSDIGLDITDPVVGLSDDSQPIGQPPTQVTVGALTAEGNVKDCLTQRATLKATSELGLQQPNCPGRKSSKPYLG